MKVGMKYLLAIFCFLICSFVYSSSLDGFYDGGYIQMFIQNDTLTFHSPDVSYYGDEVDLSICSMEKVDDNLYKLHTIDKSVYRAFRNMIITEKIRPDTATYSTITFEIPNDKANQFRINLIVDTSQYWGTCEDCCT